MISSKRKPKWDESDRGKEFWNNIFQNFLNSNKIKLYSRNTDEKAVFAERFDRLFSDLLKNVVFERGNASWVDILSTITKLYNNRVHTSTKLTPIQTSLKKNERFVC